MTQQNLSQIENGRQTMSYEQRQRAVAVLGISAEDLGLSPGRPPTELDAAVAVGVPFIRDSVQRLLSSGPMASPGAACLALAWRHRDRILGL